MPRLLKAMLKAAGGLLLIVVLLAGGMIAYSAIALGPIERDAQARMAPVIAALEAARRDAGRYPETLAELKPEYLAEIPACPRVEPAYPGQKIGEPRYRLHGDSYWLSCFIGVMVFPQDATYFSERQAWGRLD